MIKNLIMRNISSMLIVITICFFVSINGHPMFSPDDSMMNDSETIPVDLTTTDSLPSVTTEYLLTEPTVTMDSVDVGSSTESDTNSNSTEASSTMDSVDVGSSTESNTNSNSTEASSIDFNSFASHRNPSVNRGESEEDLPSPAVLSESTLAGHTGIMTVEPVLFPNWAPMSWPSSIRDFIHTLARVPLMLFGSLIGQYAEGMGLQMMALGNALLASGVQGFGYTLRDYSIGFIAFGQTVKEWFVSNEVPANSTSDATDGLPSYGNLWSALGSRYYETRLETEQLYGASF